MACTAERPADLGAAAEEEIEAGGIILQKISVHHYIDVPIMQEYFTLLDSFDAGVCDIRRV